MGKAVEKGMRGECPVAGAGAPGSGAPRIPFSTAFTIDFLRFAGPFQLPCVGSKKRQFLGTRLVWETTVYSVPRQGNLPLAFRAANKMGNKKPLKPTLVLYGRNSQNGVSFFLKDHVNNQSNPNAVSKPVCLCALNLRFETTFEVL